VVFRAPVLPVIDRMLRVMRKLNPDMGFALKGHAAGVMFAGESADFEEILGNLLENAAKWGNKQVRITVEPSNSAFVVSIADDGQGLGDDQMAEALKRGRRLDETKPGTGLGLSIVSDTVREYGGGLKLGRSDLGGLDVSIKLPRAI
jgi:signal transduction histidine kinase